MSEDLSSPLLIPGRRHRLEPGTLASIHMPANVPIPAPIAPGDEAEVIYLGACGGRVWFASGEPDDGR